MTSLRFAPMLRARFVAFARAQALFVFEMYFLIYYRKSGAEAAEIAVLSHTVSTDWAMKGSSANVGGGAGRLVRSVQGICVQIEQLLGRLSRRCIRIGLWRNCLRNTFLSA